MTPEKMIEIYKGDLQDFLINTERYALGRQSYYPPTAMDILKKYWTEATFKTKAVIRRDIETWLEQNFASDSKLIYYFEWQQTYKDLFK